ncbi:TetR/AcrR family transcriptional regulator [Burkholderia anthina]|uniref:TetR/AcrR family transcriptional regulator n=1 Tax=Burkholderia anthina TaxID=179879 RepID=UPI00158A30CE
MKKVTPDDAFLRELTNLFLDEGYSKLTVGDIAARLRCSRRRLYDMAETKEELFCAVIQQFFSNMLEEGRIASAGETDLTKVLVEYLNVGVRAASRMSAACQLDLEALEQGMDLFNRYREARSSRMRQLIESGMAQGVFVRCHAEVLTEMLSGAAAFLRRPEFLARTGLGIEQALEECCRVLLGGLLNTQVAGPESRSKP